MPQKSRRKKSNSPLFYKRMKSIRRSGRVGKYKKTSKSKVPRVPRLRKGEDPRHHSDLFVDEEKSKSIRGLRFINAEEAKKSVQKIKKLYKSGKVTFAHAKQAAMAMEQRSRFHAHQTTGIKQANKVWKEFLRKFKK